MGQIKKMGGIAKVLNMMPGMNGKAAKICNLDQSEREFIQMEAIIQSMTKEERENPSHTERKPQEKDLGGIRTAGIKDKSAGKAVRRSQEDDEAVHRTRRRKMNRMFRGFW